jgi:NADH oxidase (H2O2-forming)
MGEGKPRVIIVGCGDAGLSAAFAARKAGADVTVVSYEKEWYPRCPLPYYIGGKVSKKDLLRPIEKLFAGTGVNVVFDRAEKIKEGQVVCQNNNIDFDKAVIATGGKPKKVGDSITLRTFDDAEKIRSLAKDSKPTIVGAGMLGCELADVLGGTLIEKEDRLLPILDRDITDPVQNYLSEKTDLRTGTTESPESDFVISTAGVLPDTGLAHDSGIKVSEFGIVVDDNLETSMPGVYAAGDCIEERCFLTGKPMHSYLGPQAERQGVIAGANASGGKMKYNGSLGSIVSKVGDYEVGKVGIPGKTFGKVRTFTKPGYMKTSEEIMLKMFFDGKRLIGCQSVGRGSVSEMINIAGYAIQNNASVDDLINLPYCFSPPVCSAPHPIILCAENAKRRMKK